MDIAHGEVAIEVKDNIIIVHNQGAFNEFGVKRYTNGVKSIVNNLQGRSFSILVNNLALLGGTPEAYQELESFNTWLNHQNLTAKAMVITSSTTLDLINILSPSRVEQQTQDFDNEKDAMTWLQSLN